MIGWRSAAPAVIGAALAAAPVYLIGHWRGGAAADAVHALQQAAERADFNADLSAFGAKLAEQTVARRVAEVERDHILTEFEDATLAMAGAGDQCLDDADLDRLRQLFAPAPSGQTGAGRGRADGVR